MTFREIFQKNENEKKQYKEEIIELKKEIKFLSDEKKNLEKEIRTLKLKLSAKEKKEHMVVNVLAPACVENITVEGDFSENRLFENTNVETEKPKRSRKKKVESVEEPEKNA